MSERAKKYQKEKKKKIERELQPLESDEDLL